MQFHPEALSIREFCRRYGLSRSTVYGLIRDGKLDCRYVTPDTPRIFGASDWAERLPRKPSAS
jgi:predicted DNA-binding transcriptional regulator AlpA